MNFNPFYACRDELLKAVVRDLVGPQEADPPEEILTDPPITRYISGILFPRDPEGIEPDQDDSAEDADDDDEATFIDPPVAMANVRYPSSMGLTFGVDTRLASTLRLQITAARYEEFTDEKSGAHRWKRIPIKCAPIDLAVHVPIENGRQDLGGNLELFYRVRSANADGATPITVVLMNKNRRPEKGLRDALAFFQPNITVVDKKSTQSVFVARPSIGRGFDDDVKSNRLLYRHRAAIAVGHGCSVEWVSDSANSHRAVSVTTTFVPRYELLLADSNPTIDKDGRLSMKRLADGDRSAVLATLSELLSGYERWIAGLDMNAATLTASFAATAKEHIDGCRQALDRMRSGLRELESKADVWEAFRLANRAMLQQRSRTEWLRNDKPAPGPAATDAHRWRPFQIGFILLCIEGISNPKSTHRDLADLLWFPTGGGKTEAYLGLIAFTVFLRRLRATSDSDGITVIMRYTLRLLTIQQFERAALLICCCENIRKSQRNLRNTPISIGLWVGRGGTPNTLRDTRLALDKLHRGEVLAESNPMQLQSCPWCGTILTTSHYYIAKTDPRLVVHCKNPDCEFEKGLPIYVVDEDIYKKRPTLLIATVDKFASLPWREQAANIFNAVAEGGLPPELIIQDELHLISGPLGTLTGLYETAVDLLCTRDGIRPKVIASTATIRRAQSQSVGLFDRSVRQFPPPGLDARDSYFALEADRDSRGARLYAGLMAPGVSHATLLIRTYAALLQNIKTINASDAVRDTYWTLVGYFNSLRVLGGARMQVQDDVPERVALVARSDGAEPRLIENRIELTSREPSGDIPKHLQHMAKSLPDADTLDIILATNMISVGVDVERLGLMVVMGQPQSTSEYIQATSRVGRKMPGMVVTLFNAARSRDRSHYESFVDYHSALYRQVESTSVTPFSARSRDRGLHAVLIALARLMFAEFRPNDSAAQVSKHLDKLDLVKEAILKRVRAVDSTEEAAAKVQLDQIIKQWVDRASVQRDLVFCDFNHPDKALLVDVAGTDNQSEDSFPTAWSLRDVDKSSQLYVVG
ncbi:MAG: helicase-related protein [Planctomycetota bacterium]